MTLNKLIAITWIIAILIVGGIFLHSHFAQDVEYRFVQISENITGNSAIEGRQTHTIYSHGNRVTLWIINREYVIGDYLLFYGFTGLPQPLQTLEDYFGDIAKTKPNGMEYEFIKIQDGYLHVIVTINLSEFADEDLATLTNDIFNYSNFLPFDGITSLLLNSGGTLIEENN